MPNVNTIDMSVLMFKKKQKKVTNLLMTLKPHVLAKWTRVIVKICDSCLIITYNYMFYQRRKFETHWMVLFLWLIYSVNGLFTKYDKKIRPTQIKYFCLEPQSSAASWIITLETERNRLKNTVRTGSWHCSGCPVM